MFTDQVKLLACAGKGGNGVIAWTRAKYLPKGGPCGGDGGKGGSVIFETSKDLFSLDHLRNTKILRAKNGGDGSSDKRKGRDGKDLVIKIPCGTLLKDAVTGEILHDFTENGEKLVLVKGGKGGFGNDRFKTPTNRAPRKCTPGRAGEETEIELELKLIADVGFVGMPNAGKSTLLSTLTAHPVKIGRYAFTTLAPNLSYLEFDDYSRIYLADIPGIIRDAHKNRGLGLSFLRHIERSEVLVFVIDAAAEDARDPFEDFAILRKELEKHDATLLEKPFLVCLNKADLPESADLMEDFEKKYPFDKSSLFKISAKEDTGLKSFVSALREIAQAKEIRYV